MTLSLPLSFPSLLFLLTVGKWFRAIFSNLYAGHQVVAWSVDLCGSTSVVIFFFFLCGFVQILQTFQTLMGVDIVTYDISTYQCMLTVIPFVPGTSFTRATLGANGVADEFFLDFIFYDIGVQFLKDVGLLRGSIACCKCGSLISWCVDANRDLSLQSDEGLPRPLHACG